MEIWKVYCSERKIVIVSRTTFYYINYDALVNCYYSEVRNGFRCFEKAFY